MRCATQTKTEEVRASHLSEHVYDINRLGPYLTVNRTNEIDLSVKRCTLQPLCTNTVFLLQFVLRILPTKQGDIYLGIGISPSAPVASFHRRRIPTRNELVSLEGL